MKENIHIHLDPMGGISGDMFISAMIDADSSFKKLAKTISKIIIKDIEIIIIYEKIPNIVLENKELKKKYKFICNFIYH